MGSNIVAALGICALHSLISKLLISTLPPPAWTYKYSAKTVYRKFETYIPRNESAPPQSQFIHSCVCERFIYSHDRSAHSAAGKYVGRSWEYINHSQIHECGNWDWGCAVSYLLFHIFLGGIFLIYLFFILNSTLLHLPPSDSTVLTDAGIEPRTVATGALAVSRSNHLARSHPETRLVLICCFFFGK